MKKKLDIFSDFSPDIFKDKAYDDAVKEFPKDAFVYIEWGGRADRHG